MSLCSTSTLCIGSGIFLSSRLDPCSAYISPRFLVGNPNRACRFVFPRVFGRNHSIACRFDPQSRALRTATKYGARVSTAQWEAFWLCQATTYCVCFLKVQVPLIFATMRPDDHHHAMPRDPLTAPKGAARCRARGAAAGATPVGARAGRRTSATAGEAASTYPAVPSRKRDSLGGGTPHSGKNSGYRQTQSRGGRGGSRFFSGSLSLLQNLDHTNVWSKGG